MTQFLNQAAALPQFTKHNFLKTFVEQLGFLSIASVRDEMRTESSAARAALEAGEGGIDAWNDLMNDASFAAENALFADNAGLITIPDLPKTQLFSAYKSAILKMRQSQMNSKYPVRGLSEQVASTASMNENNIDTKKLVAETSGFLDAQAKAAGLDMDVISKSYARRASSNSARAAKKVDSLAERVNTEFTNAYPDTLESLWMVLPVYAQWRVVIALYKDLNRAAGGLKADAESNVKNPWSTAAADFDAVIQAAAALRAELEDMQKDHGSELKLAFEGRKLFENHILN